MDEEFKPPFDGKELNLDEMEQITGGTLTEEEIEEYLNGVEGDDVRHAWDVAIGLLINYKGWTYERYAGIVDQLADLCIPQCRIRIGKEQFKSIMLQAYTQFYWKMYH